MTSPEQAAAPQPLHDPNASRRSIERWLREHANIAQLLVLIESQLGALEAGDDTDDELMLDAMTYLTDFVDGFHQALEDLALEAAVEREPRLREVQHELEAQHARIRELGAWLREALERALMDAPVGKQELARCGFAYTAEMRSNMRLEEGSVFPALERSVDPATWSRLAAKLSEHPDPLFGDVVHERYATLFRELAGRFGLE
jgi:hemerythrin-like domain-containing protein